MHIKIKTNQGDNKVITFEFCYNIFFEVIIKLQKVKQSDIKNILKAPEIENNNPYKFKFFYIDEVIFVLKIIGIKEV